MNEIKKRIQSDIISRMKWVHLLLVVIMLVIFGRLIWIQFADSTIATISERLHKNIITKRTVRARRGSILSRDGEMLATSIFRNSISIDFGSEGFDNTEKFLDEADSLSKMLERHFKQGRAKDYFAQMSALQRSSRKLVQTGERTVRYSKGFFEELFGIKNCDSIEKVYTTKRTHTSKELFGEVDDNEWEILSTYPILNGSLGKVLLRERIDSRIYPQGNLARRIIGRIDRKTPYGIEHAYRDSLAGCDGYNWVQYVARDFYATYTDADHRPKEAVNGMDIVTTLDVDVQDVADRALRESLTKNNGVWGTTIVMECQTGDILAMVNLERGSDGQYFEGRNYAIGGRMEPGSTIKLATTITLLDDAKMSPSKRYHSGLGRSVKVTKYNNIKDSHVIGKETKGRISLETAFAESANVFFAKAVNEHYKDDPQRYVEALKRLHLHKRVGLEEFGSVEPVMPSPVDRRDIWYGSTLCMLAYGYGLEVSPLNTITLYNAIANNGRMVAPRVILRMERDGKTVHEYPVKELIPKVCSDSTLHLVRHFMEQAAEVGTGAAIFGENFPFKVGLKTGTATIAQGKSYKEGYHLGSMVTYLPADNPRYTVMTAIYKRKDNSSVAGATIAGPVQRSVAYFLYNREEEWAKRVDEQQHHIETTLHIKGGNTAHIRRTAGEIGIRAHYDNQSGWGSTTMGLDKVSIKAIATERNIMPDVIGMGLSDALFLLEKRGLKVDFEGKGCVVEQSPQANESVKEGSRVKIRLSNNLTKGKSR